MAKIEIEFDASLLMKMYKKGFEDAFIILSEFNELNEELNLNNIDSGKTGD